MPNNDPDFVWRGRVKNGVRQYFSPTKHTEYLKQLEGKEFEEITRLEQVPVSDDQHGYLRGAIIRNTLMKTEMFAGWSETEIYNYFADKYFFIPRMKEMNGKQVQFKERLSMATCGMKRATEFIQNILVELAQENIYPPEPYEVNLNRYSSKQRSHDNQESKTDQKT